MNKYAYQIGFDEYLNDHLEDLSDEYYGRPQLDPGELYIWDSGFRSYCHSVWEDTVNSYEDSKY